ncbi:hypothetical protein OEA41_009937 [Lepraria neglecta]|uniref:Haloacid dehalogenase n=1 Tax=Lepraria neglecta TaxID=209136 RepID=A0AAE0DDC9_9LECA|nr:hypothetical protein OEA41_009937 [Lepraria neglecta]
MKVRTDDPSRLSDFKLLSFDCFGTLVDWESGIYEELKPLLARLPPSNPLKNNKDLAVNAYNDLEVSLCASKPNLKYSSLLSESYLSFASSLSLPPPPQSEADAIGASVRKWPAFPDTVAALNRLKKHYKLVILSNIDKESFSQVLAGSLAGVEFDAVYVAEEIGSYKPDLKNFEYLLEHVKSELGVEKAEVLHTAHGIRADHVPTKQMGMTSAWIARGRRPGRGVR